MTRFLSLLIVVMVGAEVFGLDLSLVQGLSVKNVLLYGGVIVLMIRAAMTRGLTLDLPRVQACFWVPPLYALLTMAAIMTFEPYSDYLLTDAVVNLKTKLVDPLLFFALFFYGASTLRQAERLANGYLLAFLIGSAAMVVTALGVASFEGVTVSRGRVGGVFGHPNDFAGLAALVLPVFLAPIAASRGLRRVAWIAAAAISATAFVLTLSRGAFLGLFVASVYAIVHYRSRLSPRMMTRIVAGGILLATVAAILLMSVSEELMFARVATTGSAQELTSGRNEIWAAALARMVADPWSFVTGFGWSSYRTMGFYYAQHNEYLSYWFDLGIIGLASISLLVVQAFRISRRMSERSGDLSSLYLLGGSMGILAFSIVIFFTNIGSPWPYAWGFVGILMRIAVLSGVAAAAEGTAPASLDAVTDQAMIHKGRP